MTERVKVNFYIDAVTDDGLDKLAEKTHRSKGMVIDWLVEEKMMEIEFTPGKAPLIADAVQAQPETGTKLNAGDE